MAIDYMKESPETIQHYLSYTRNVRNRSKQTVVEYFKDLRAFFRFYKIEHNIVSKESDFDSIEITDITLEQIKSVTMKDTLMFMEFLSNQGNSSSSKARRISALRSFYKYLTEQYILEKNPIENLHLPKKEKKLPKYLSLEESINLLNSVESDFLERDYCILTLFLNCGFRLSELAKININDIRSDNYIVIHGKGSKERQVYLNDACQDAIKNYLNNRPEVTNPNDKNALFISRKGNRLCVSMIQKIVYKALRQIGLNGQGFSTHKLRHTAATLMYQNGNVDILTLKEILGHESTATTEIYTHLSQDQIKEATISNPLSKIKK